jgi:hypothetical protein
MERRSADVRYVLVYEKVVRGNTNKRSFGLLRESFGLISAVPIRSLTCINWLTVIANTNERGAKQGMREESSVYGW